MSRSQLQNDGSRDTTLSLLQQMAASDPRHLICVTRLIERKGQHYLIQALRHLVDTGHNVMLELVGEGV